MRSATFVYLAFAILAAAQTPDGSLPEFDVASIKPINPNARNAIDIKVIPGGRLIITATSLQRLIAVAYGDLQLYQVAGPGWISNTFFDLDAQPPENDYGQEPTVTALGRQFPLKTMLRLRSLLIARFNLKTHFENRDRTVYELSVAKDGPKLKPADPKDAAGCEGGFRSAVASIEASSCSMPWLADRLARFAFQTDVFDKTGLTDLYDFKIEFSPIGSYAPAAQPEADPPSLPSLFTAIQSLGLKIEARKAPMQVVVVDHVDKLTAN